MKAQLWVVLGIAACVISWSYMHRVLLPWEHYVNVERGRVKEQMGDLYPRWVGTKELLLHGKNPYGPEVSREIQNAFYGHPIQQNYDKPEFEIVDEQRFAYPVYVVFLLAPTVHAEFSSLQAWAPVVFALLTAASVWVWLDALRWRPSLFVTAAVMLFVLSSPQVAQGLRLRQFGLLVAFVLALATWCVSRGHNFAAGVLLAVATVKPQMGLFVLGCFSIWIVGDWRRRWRLALGFLGAMAVLVAAGEILLPAWPRFFVEGLAAYSKYFPLGTKTIARLILGNWIGGAFSVVAILALIRFAWDRRHFEADSSEFFEVLSLFLIAATLVLPLLAPYNQVLLLLPAVIALRDWQRLNRWSRTVFAVLLGWPFAASLLLLACRPDVNSFRRTPLLPSVLLVLTPFLMLWIMFDRRRMVAGSKTTGTPALFL